MFDPGIARQAAVGNRTVTRWGNPDLSGTQERRKNNHGLHGFHRWEVRRSAAVLRCLFSVVWGMRRSPPSLGLEATGNDVDERNYVVWRREMTWMSATTSFGDGKWRGRAQPWRLATGNDVGERNYVVWRQEMAKLRATMRFGDGK
jgi:hypothetical protein